MALLIARSIPDTTVDTITLSIEQAEHIRKLIEEDRRRWMGRNLNGDSTDLVFPVGDRVRVHVLDFRSMPKRWAGAFDRVISVEMVEAIGKDMYEVYTRLVPIDALVIDDACRDISLPSIGPSNGVLVSVSCKV